LNCRDFNSYFSHAIQNRFPTLPQLLHGLIANLHDSDSQVLVDTLKALDGLVNCLNKDKLPDFVPDVRKQLKQLKTLLLDEQSFSR
jgi:hypothetical protein